MLDDVRTTLDRLDMLWRVWCDLDIERGKHRWFYDQVYVLGRGVASSLISEMHLEWEQDACVLLKYHCDRQMAHHRRLPDGSAPWIDA